ncbi:hypothetical protein BZA05DRAFT_440185 [Tricharina praecox]|uniref:uncharacterized protein n=1 Tax=Tricharina praecox TaxID=43433 RepID=UPI00221EBB82|nr:uncharacterized protein BZA05DRAFT_440185 [Tricharina praecox]KAI5858538.1 hypothetical protein BZA05DRAFT_440185 [Tricharina praecox]
MLATRLLQSAARTYKARHPWPPDFSLLSQKEQFRLERRYRRRAKLKWARPRLMKAVTFTQWGSVAFVLGYGVFWADWGNDGHIFLPIRNWVAEKKASFWSVQVPAAPQSAAGGRATPATDERK